MHTYRVVRCMQAPQPLISNGSLKCGSIRFVTSTPPYKNKWHMAMNTYRIILSSQCGISTVGVYTCWQDDCSCTGGIHTSSANRKLAREAWGHFEQPESIEKDSRAEVRVCNPESCDLIGVHGRGGCAVFYSQRQAQQRGFSGHWTNVLDWILCTVRRQWPYVCYWKLTLCDCDIINIHTIYLRPKKPR